MILAFFTFGFGLVQVLFNLGLVSTHKKVIFGLVVTILSSIPLMCQFIGLLAELSRARKYSTQLLVHRMVMTIFGDYGPAANLVLKQFRHKKLGELEDLQGGLWHCIVYVLHGFTKIAGRLAFGDAFSGIFNVRHVSVALWIDDRSEPWVGCKKPDIEKDDFFGKPCTKVVRDVRLTIEFSPITEEQATIVSPTEDGRDVRLTVEEEQSTVVHPTEEKQSKIVPPTEAGQSMMIRSTREKQPTKVPSVEENQSPMVPPTAVKQQSTPVCPPEEKQPTMVTFIEGLQSTMAPPTKDKQPRVTYDLFATGSRDSLVAKLYCQSWKGNCPRENALEFCTLMHTLNNDSFVVKCCPPDKNDEILVCEELDDIVRYILDDSKKINAKRVNGMSYV